MRQQETLNTLRREDYDLRCREYIRQLQEKYGEAYESKRADYDTLVADCQSINPNDTHDTLRVLTLETSLADHEFNVEAQLSIQLGVLDGELHPKNDPTFQSVLVEVLERIFGRL